MCRLVGQETSARCSESMRRRTAFPARSLPRRFESTAATLSAVTEEGGGFFFSFFFLRLCKSNCGGKKAIIGTPCFVPSPSAHADRRAATAAERQVAKSRAQAESEAPPGRAEQQVRERRRARSVEEPQTDPTSAAGVCQTRRIPQFSRCGKHKQSQPTSIPLLLLLLVPPPAPLLIKLSSGLLAATCSAEAT